MYHVSKIPNILIGEQYTKTAHIQVCAVFITSLPVISSAKASSLPSMQSFSVANPWRVGARLEEQVGSFSLKW